MLPEDREAMERWRRDGHLWVCPEGSNDDWYWMLATVILGEPAPEGSCLVGRSFGLLLDARGRQS